MIIIKFKNIFGAGRNRNHNRKPKQYKEPRPKCIFFRNVKLHMKRNIEIRSLRKLRKDNR